MPFSSSDSQWPDAVGVKVVVRTTEDAHTAELWRAEFSAGRLPEITENGR